MFARLARPLALGCALGCLTLAACGAGGAPGGAQDAGSDAGGDSGTPLFPDGGIAPLGAGLAISGQPDAGLGSFDPSAVWDPIADAGLLVYSVVPDQAHVHARLATSIDRGASWSYLGEPDQAGAASISTSDLSVCGQSTCAGTTAHEVPSLLVDPGDTAERRYKIFTHSYFIDAAAGLHYQLGAIELLTAASPSGPWSTTPLLGWNSSSPVSTQGVSQNVSTDARLSGAAHCLALTEPGALLRTVGAAQVIDLALGCVFLLGSQPATEIELLRSTDHARSFSFVATLLSAGDATALGSNHPQINAADLFEFAGRDYLFATPGGEVEFAGGPGPGYRGCLLLRFADLESGALDRDGSGTPRVIASYLGGAMQFVGACTAREALPGLGVAGDVLDISSSAPFAIFSIR